MAALQAANEDHVVHTASSPAASDTVDADPYSPQPPPDVVDGDGESEEAGSPQRGDANIADSDGDGSVDEEAGSAGGGMQLPVSLDELQDMDVQQQLSILSRISAQQNRGAGHRSSLVRPQAEAPSSSDGSGSGLPPALQKLYNQQRKQLRWSR